MTMSFKALRQVHPFGSLPPIDETGGFLLPSSQTVMDKQLAKGCYTEAWVRFEPTSCQLQGKIRTATPRDEIII